MILTKSEIVKQVTQGHIVIDPFDAKLVNPNSYNYHLGETLIELDDLVIDPATSTSGTTLRLDDTGFVLVPGRVYLGSTQERIGSDRFVTSLIGRSSVGRLGLFVQITADLGNLGAKHQWTLELTVVQPLRIYPGMHIGQVSFWETEGSRSQLYAGKYRQQTGPLHSRMHVETAGLLPIGEDSGLLG